MHQEIHVRIGIELIKHVDFYLNDDILTQDLPSKTNLASRYATYSEQYKPDSVQTKTVTRHIYEMEVQNVSNQAHTVGSGKSMP